MTLRRLHLGFEPAFRSRGGTHQVKCLSGPGGSWMQWAGWGPWLTREPTVVGRGPAAQGRLLPAAEWRPSCWSSSFSNTAINLDIYVQLQSFTYRKQFFLKKVLYGPNKSKQTIKVMSAGCVVFVLPEYTDSSPASTDGIGLTLIISLVVFTVLVLHRHVFWDVFNLDTANACKSCDTIENTSKGSPQLW